MYRSTHADDSAASPRDAKGTWIGDDLDLGVPAPGSFAHADAAAVPDEAFVMPGNAAEEVARTWFALPRAH